MPEPRGNSLLFVQRGELRGTPALGQRGKDPAEDLRESAGGGQGGREGRCGDSPGKGGQQGRSSRAREPLQGRSAPRQREPVPARGPPLAPRWKPVQTRERDPARRLQGGDLQHLERPAQPQRPARQPRPARAGRGSALQGRAEAERRRAGARRRQSRSGWWGREQALDSPPYGGGTGR